MSIIPKSLIKLIIPSKHDKADSDLDLWEARQAEVYDKYTQELIHEIFEKHLSDFEVVFNSDHEGVLLEFTYGKVKSLKYIPRSTVHISEVTLTPDAQSSKVLNLYIAYNLHQEKCFFSQEEIYENLGKIFTDRFYVIERHVKAGNVDSLLINGKTVEVPLGRGQELYDMIKKILVR